MSNPTKASMHPSVTQERVLELHNRRTTTLDDPGICLACGAEAECVEPDARDYACAACGEHRVVGSEEAVLLFR